MKLISASALIDFLEIFYDNEQFILQFLIALGGNDIGHDLGLWRWSGSSMKGCKDE
jgi:hypothetical protein